MYVYLCICMYMCMCMCIYVCICVCICMYMYVYVYVYLCISMYMYVYLCICVCICVQDVETVTNSLMKCLQCLGLGSEQIDQIEVVDITVASPTAKVINDFDSPPIGTV